MPYRVENNVEKEKVLVPSNLSFSHNVFHSYICLVRQNVALCGNGLICILGAVILLYFLISTSQVGGETGYMGDAYETQDDYDDDVISLPRRKGHPVAKFDQDTSSSVIPDPEV